MVPFVVDRYEVMAELASGGEGTVFLGRLRGEGGFRRLVALKRLHAHLSKDPAAVAPFRDEARIASRIRHPNVVATLDVLDREGNLYIVMDYVDGETVAAISRAPKSLARGVPASIAAAIACDLLEGLHAAHEATDESGAPLSVVHRDVSPQNVLVGKDGVTRITDFGVAKATGRLTVTTDDRIKGKLGYTAPEQILGSVDRRTDVFAASVVLWELLAGRRLFDDEHAAQTMARILAGDVPALELSGGAQKLLDVVALGLAPAPDDRYPTAHEMALAVRRAVPVATAFDVAEWLGDVLGAELAARTELAFAVERAPSPTQRRRGRRLALALTLGLGTAVAAVAARSLFAKTSDAAPRPSAPVSAPDSASAQASPSAQALLSTLPSPASAAPLVTSARVVTTVAPPKPSTARCQKSWWDARGIRHFNPECNLD